MYQLKFCMNYVVIFQLVTINILVSKLRNIDYAIRVVFLLSVIFEQKFIERLYNASHEGIETSIINVILYLAFEIKCVTDFPGDPLGTGYLEDLKHCSIQKINTNAYAAIRKNCFISNM